MGATLIRFVCVRAEHRPKTFAADPALTIHEGGWAFCPQSTVGDHQWQLITPRTRDDLARWARTPVATPPELQRRSK
jgi:hypothetical protein